MPKPDLGFGDDTEITTTLLMVSQLRDLFLRLPHLSTPRERAELEEFQGYRKSKGKLETVRIPVVQTGFREAWRTGDLDSILDVGQRIPDTILRGDLDIQMYYVMAHRRLTESQAGQATIRDR